MAGYHWGIRFNYRNAPEFILLCTRVRRLYVWTCSTKKERPLWCSRTHHVFFYGAVTVDDEAIDCSLRRYMARESSLNPLRKGRYVPGDFFIPFFPLDAFFLFFYFLLPSRYTYKDLLYVRASIKATSCSAIAGWKPPRLFVGGVCLCVCIFPHSAALLVKYDM